MRSCSANISGTERGKAGCALLALSLLAASAGHAEPPNVVLIYADDLGYGDLGCYPGEGRIETPHCDRLAEEGCRFTDAYTAASVCTPARYSLLTGRYPWRTWLKKGVVGNTPALIDPGRFTMADLFREAGYRTAAIGKWHLGFGERGRKELDWNAEIPGGPCELGFDEFFGMPVSHFYPPFVYIENRRVLGLDPADPLSLEFPEKRGPPRQVGGRAATYDPEEAGRDLVERACRYVKENRDAPFFLYYAAIEPHTPFTPHPDYRGSSDAGLYGDFVVQFDDGVGRLLRTLDEEGLADDTIVILTSDNGGISPRNGHFEKHDIDYDPNGPLRGDKGDALEGGLRIPFLVRWPGVVNPGAVSSEIICQTDLVAAFADLLDRPLPAGAAEDSRNVLAALKGEPAPDEPIVLQSRAGFHALRRGEWIYLDVEHEGDLRSRGAVEPPGQLYRLSSDLHQDDNLYREKPEVVADMAAKLEAIRNRSRVGAAGRSGEPEREKPMLLANYYTWYHDGSHPDRPWQGWTREAAESNPRALARQREGEPPLASPIRPLAGLYDSRDRGVADWHVALAKAAGIDAFLVDWWGEHLGRDENAEAGIIAACEASGFPWAILDERAQFHRDFEDYAGWVLDAMKRYFSRENYLELEGRPVWYLYQVASNPGLTTDEFTRLRLRVESEVGPVYWIVDKIEHDRAAARARKGNREKRIPEEWLRVQGIDAFSFYSTFSHFRAHRYEQLIGRYRYLTNMAHRAGKRMVLPVHPGHDNSHFREEGDFYVMPRRGGDTFRDYLRAASDAGADFVMVTSWNEWPENTVIEPSADWEDPYRYLRILAQWRGKEFVPVPPPASVRHAPKETVEKL